MDTAEVLRKRGYRATPQRIAIYEALCHAGDHPTVEQIHEHAKQRDPTMSLATVYKTLQLFTEINLAREISFRDKPTRYDTDVDSHIHLICVDCGSIIDYNTKSFDNIAERVERDLGFKMTNQDFGIFGHCEKCGKQE